MFPEVIDSRGYLWYIEIDMEQTRLNKHGNRRGMHPNSLKNMSKPGDLHNPRARGTYISLIPLLKIELKRVPDKGPDGKPNTKKRTYAQLIARIMVEEAVDGNLPMIRDILDRVDGKPVQSVSGPSGGPLEIRQEVKVIGADDIKPVLAALVECGAVQVCQN